MLPSVVAVAEGDAVVGSEEAALQLEVSGQSPHWFQSVFPSSSTSVGHQDTPNRFPFVVQLV